MGETKSKVSKLSGERRSGLIVAALFAIGLVYVAISYARFHQMEYGEERYVAGRADLCRDIAERRPFLHKQLTSDEFC